MRFSGLGAERRDNAALGGVLARGVTPRVAFAVIMWSFSGSQANKLLAYRLSIPRPWRQNMMTKIVGVLTYAAMILLLASLLVARLRARRWDRVHHGRCDRWHALAEAARQAPALQPLCRLISTGASDIEYHVYGLGLFRAAFRLPQGAFKEWAQDCGWCLHEIGTGGREWPTDLGGDSNKEKEHRITVGSGHWWDTDDMIEEGPELGGRLEGYGRVVGVYDSAEECVHLEGVYVA